MDTASELRSKVTPRIASISVRRNTRSGPSSPLTLTSVVWRAISSKSLAKFSELAIQTRPLGLIYREASKTSRLSSQLA